ncbi:MAG TPA: hypothetical protein VMH04_22450 [Candidatus Solibacter sp.]|nr:hypothetical protein [Candidatus Solibacter sp.]
MRKIALLTAFVSMLVLCAGSAWAQTTIPVDTLKVDYFANANTAGAPDATLRITNPGTYASGNICASIYVFDPEQELSACCSCLLTPDGLRTLSIDKDVTVNPLTGVTLTTGLIKIASTIPVSGTCPLPTVVHPVAAIRSWTTHIQSGGFAVTEGASQDATLSAGEISRLGRECYAIALVGSGKGICSCGTGD